MSRSVATGPRRWRRSPRSRCAAAMGWTPAAAPEPDGRRARPAAPPPQAVETSTPRPDPRLAGPPGRPADPTPAPRPGARWVDDQLAHRIGVRTDHHRPARRPSRRRRSTPKTTNAAKTAPQASSDVELTHPAPGEYAGASDLTAHGDTLTLQAFYDLVCAIAHQLFRRRRHQPARRTQDQSPRRDRRPRHRTRHPRPRDGSRHGRQDQGLRRTSRPTTSTRTAVGTVEKLGAATLAKIKSWVGHHQVVIQPVLNLQRRDAVDSHDPPPWMRELVILRDGHCVFPGCTRDARACDLDHIQPLRPRTAHPAKPAPTTSPASADDTTAPRPSDSGATPARPTVRCLLARTTHGHWPCDQPPPDRTAMSSRT